MAEAETQDQVHKDGTEHIKDKVFGEGEGTTTSAGTPKPEHIEPAKAPASNPSADDPSAGIAKDAGGVSVAANVGSPSTGNKEKRKSIVGQLKGLFLGGDKKEREASEAGTAKQGGTTTGAVAAGATGTGGATGKAVDTPVKTKSTEAASEPEPRSTTEQVKEAVTGDKEANTGAATASTSEPTETKPETSDDKMEEPTDTSGSDAHKPPAPAGGKPPENRDAIPTAGGERLGDKHWGESKIVPENPKPVAEETPGVSSAEGQPTEEVKDNTAKNTGGASSGPTKTETPATAAGEKEKKGKFMDKVKDKLPFGKK